MRVKLFQSCNRDIKKIEKEINDWIAEYHPIIDSIENAVSIAPGDNAYTTNIVYSVLVLYDYFSDDEIN